MSDLNPEIPVFDVATMQALVERRTITARFVTVLLGLFAALVLILASLGVYGAMAQAVVRHLREIGIRLALGARRQDVLRLILGRGAAVGLCGIAGGLAGFGLLGRLLSALLFDVSPHDVPTVASASFLLFGVTLLACYVPARRAASVDPVRVLRAD